MNRIKLSLLCALVAAFVAFAPSARAADPGVTITVKPVGDWFIEENLTHPHVTVLFHWEMTSKFIAYHAAADVLHAYSLKDAARDCADARKRGARCSKIQPIPGVPRSAAFTIRSKHYLNARVAYREFRLNGHRATVHFYGSWSQGVDKVASRDFDRMVREAKISFVQP